MQGGNRDTAVEKGLADTAGEAVGGTKWESSTDVCTLPRASQTASGRLPGNTGSLAQALRRPRRVRGSRGMRYT